MGEPEPREERLQFAAGTTARETIEDLLRRTPVNRTLLVVALLFLAACSPADGPPVGASERVTDPDSTAVDSSNTAATPSRPSESGPQPAPDQSAQLPAESRAPTDTTSATPRQPGVPAELPPIQPSSEANAVLARAERAYLQVRSMQADFTQAVYVPLLDSTQNSRGRLFHRAPDSFLMRFSDPQGDVIVADGQYVWMYYPSTDDGQVMRAPLAAGSQQVDLYHEFLADATSRYAASLDGAESVGGRPSKALTLVPREPSGYRRVRIWVDDQDSLVRRFEISEENGSVRRLELSGLRINVELSDTLFQFTPPPGVQVHDF